MDELIRAVTVSLNDETPSMNGQLMENELIPDFFDVGHDGVGIRMDEIFENDVVPIDDNLVNNVISELEQSLSRDSHVTSPASLGSILSPALSHPDESYHSNSHQSPRYIPNIEPVTVSYTLTDFRALKMEVDTLINAHRTLNETREMINVDTRIIEHMQNYNVTLRKLLDADKELYVLYETYLNECLTQRHDVCVSNEQFVTMKSFLNNLLELALSMISISFEEATFQTRVLIESVLTKAFLVIVQPRQIVNINKTFDAAVGLICHPTISINYVHPVTVSFFSGKC